MVDTLHPPLEVVASFPKPNYDNPETHGPALVVLAILLSFIAIFVVGTRLYARFYITKALGIDDLLIVLALVFGIAASILVIIGNRIYYSGHHVWDIPHETAVGHRLNVWMCQLFFMLALCFVKVSVLLFYRRLSVSFSKTFMIATWIGIAYNVAYVLGAALSLLLVCRPTHAYWLSFDPIWATTHEYTCGSEQIGQPLVAWFSVLGDFYSALLPMMLVRRLSLPRKQKRALYLLFSLAYLVVIVGLIRAVYMYKIVNVDYDFTWTLWKIWVLGIIELWFALYTASAPALKPIFERYIFKKLPGSLASSEAKAHVVRSNASGGLGRVEEIYSAPRNAHTFHNVHQKTGPSVVCHGGMEPVKQCDIRQYGDEEMELQQLRKTHNRNSFERKFAQPPEWMSAARPNMSKPIPIKPTPGRTVMVNATIRSHTTYQKC